jgi:hypothetical protein
MQRRPGEYARVLLICLTLTACACRTAGPADLGRVRDDAAVYVVRAGAPVFEVKSLRQKQAIATGAAIGGLVGALVSMALMKGMDTGADLQGSLSPREAHARLASRVIAGLAAEASPTAPRWVDAGEVAPSGAPSLVLKLDTWGIKAEGAHDALRPIVEVTGRLSKNGAVLWKAECDAEAIPRGAPLPSLAEVRQDRDLLRGMMERAIDACADELTARLLGGATPAAAVAEKRELRAKGKSLAEIERIVLGDTSTPGLASGRFDARFNEVTLSAADVERLQRLIRASMFGDGESELRLAGTIDGRQFEARMERNRAGRARVRFEGLQFLSDADAEALLGVFTGPGVQKVNIQGEAAGRPIKRSHPPR